MRLLFLIFAVGSALTKQEAVLNLCSGLNYALSLEHLEAAFYQQVNALYSSDGDYSKMSSKNGEKLKQSVVRARLAEIGAHEDAHVVAVTGILNNLATLIPGVSGCEPVSACTYNFNLGTTRNNKKDINTVLATAELLESTGVKAYDGAIASLIQCTADGSVDDATIVTAAATIATVEARHAAYLRTLLGLDPFPFAFDPTLTPNQVLCAARQFVVNPSTCPVFSTAAC